MSAYSGWMRNYKAMGDEKLTYALKELEGGYGDAWYRVQDKGGLIDEHLAEARAQARIRGILDGETIVTPIQPEGALGEAKECSDCGKRRRHYVDDYICKDCRDALNGPIEKEIKQTKLDGDSPNADDLMAKLNEALNA